MYPVLARGFCSHNSHLYNSIVAVNSLSITLYNRGSISVFHVSIIDALHLGDLERYASKSVSAQFHLLLRRFKLRSGNVAAGGAILGFSSSSSRSIMMSFAFGSWEDSYRIFESPTIAKSGT